jgi:hypothetical protein
MHYGFAEDAFSILFRIMAEHKNDELNFGGHSKGADEAEVLAAHWDLAGCKVGRVTALEPARVGLLGGRIASKPGISTRVKSGLIIDPVPALPGWLDHPRELTVLEAATRLLLPTDCHLLENVHAAMLAAA